jgi:AcrR family transcriptional regulator
MVSSTSSGYSTDSVDPVPKRRARAREASSRGPGRPKGDPGAPNDVAERLLDAATELAAEQSFDACGLREIAARADVSSGMISYYFGDRRGLYEAMFQRAIDRVSDQVQTLLDVEPKGEGLAGSRLDDLLALHVSAIAADPWLPKLMANTEVSLQRVLADRVGTGAMPMMIAWIEGEQRRGMLRKDIDARLLTVSIVSLSVFPFLMLPIVGADLGIEVDEAFPERLIEHNQRLLARGIRCETENA